MSASADHVFETGSYDSPELGYAISGTPRLPAPASSSATRCGGVQFTPTAATRSEAAHMRAASLKDVPSWSRPPSRHEKLSHAHAPRTSARMPSSASASSPDGIVSHAITSASLSARTSKRRR